MPGFLIRDKIQSSGRDRNEKKFMSTSQRNFSISDGNKITIFTFQYWGLAPQAMQTPAAYDED